MEILLVEDERKVVAFLEGALVAEGHRVHVCLDLEQLSDFIATRTLVPDIIILDRMLQGSDGIRMIAPAKKAFPDAKILILSAILSHEEKAAALDLGADDYMCKPFSLIELSARIRALARRPSGEASRYLEVTDLRVDLLNRAVFVAERKVDLSNKEYQLLTIFMKSPGRVFDKFRLQNLVWDTQAEIESNVVEVTMRNLRRKLSEAGFDSTRIQSRRNVGYWLEN